MVVKPGRAGGLVTIEGQENASRVGWSLGLVATGTRELAQEVAVVAD